MIGLFIFIGISIGAGLLVAECIHVGLMERQDRHRQLRRRTKERRMQAGPRQDRRKTLLNSH